MNTKEVRTAKEQEEQTTKTATATCEQLTKTLQELLRDNIIGVTKAVEKTKLEFRLPNGQVFLISVEEK